MSRSSSSNNNGNDLSGLPGTDPDLLQLLGLDSITQTTSYQHRDQLFYNSKLGNAVYAFVTINAISICLSIIVVIMVITMVISKPNMGLKPSFRLSAWIALSDIIYSTLKIVQSCHIHMLTFSDKGLRAIQWMLYFSGLVFMFLTSCIVLHLQLTVLHSKVHWAAKLNPFYETVCIVLALALTQPFMYKIMTAWEPDVQLIASFAPEKTLTGLIWGCVLSWMIITLVYCIIVCAILVAKLYLLSRWTKPLSVEQLSYPNSSATILPDYHQQYPAYYPQNQYPQGSENVDGTYFSNTSHIYNTKGKDTVATEALLIEHQIPPRQTQDQEHQQNLPQPQFQHTFPGLLYSENDNSNNSHVSGRNNNNIENGPRLSLSLSSSISKKRLHSLNSKSSILSLGKKSGNHLHSKYQQDQELMNNNDNSHRKFGLEDMIRLEKEEMGIISQGQEDDGGSGIHTPSYYLTTSKSPRQSLQLKPQFEEPNSNEVDQQFGDDDHQSKKSKSINDANTIDRIENQLQQHQRGFGIKGKSKTGKRHEHSRWRRGSKLPKKHDNSNYNHSYGNYPLQPQPQSITNKQHRTHLKLTILRVMLFPLVPIITRTYTIVIDSFAIRPYSYTANAMLVAMQGVLNFVAFMFNPGMDEFWEWVAKKSRFFRWLFHGGSSGTRGGGSSGISSSIRSNSGKSTRFSSKSIYL
ncbi:hypothetical protein H4219_004869 [Mycoemilia scoparia]|uniref:Uncharacterized protein n=1 Tax=Mycoemilia scoparia TaxID=417184 RepID=A0A9W8DQM5_9FUNG|nr:hypothetical protein H4219_004869 [Mycoemilia scoparia]